MSSSANPSLPHRTISSIRAGESSAAPPRSTGTPHTPVRGLSGSVLGSPSSLRADDDILVVELGTRRLRVGFAGDAAPKRVVSFRPEEHKRVGDFRAWDPGYANDWRKRTAGLSWEGDHELWKLDVRGQDMDLVGDKVERALRDAFTKYGQMVARYLLGLHG